MMNKSDEFYVSYIDGTLGPKTKSTLKRFCLLVFGLIIIGAVIFGFSQNPFKNSSFELTKETKITGTLHQNPYPMLRIKVGENNFKNILLLGFGKLSANTYLNKLRSQHGDLNGKTLSIEGNLIYYNSKTLIQINNKDKITVENKPNTTIPQNINIGEVTFQGEIIDPKCYFGVMKPGKGKIHRSCAIRCISGGIPPVLATTDKNNISEYFLLTDMNKQPINKEILSYVGKPSNIKGYVEKMEDWHILKINLSDIEELMLDSSIY